MKNLFLFIILTASSFSYSSPCENAMKAQASALSGLEEALKEENIEVRLWAIGLLAKIGELALPLLEESLKDKNVFVRVFAVKALVKIGKPARSLLESKGLPVLKEAMKEYAYSMWHERRIEIVNLLAKIGELALPLVEEALKDEDIDVRMDAVKALVKIGKPARSLLESKGLPLLKEAMEKYTSSIWYERRIDVVKVLAKIGELALPLVEEALKDENIDVRIEAVGALVKIGKPARSLLESKGLPVLKEALEEYTGSIWYESRVKIVKLLGKIGEPAIPLLKEAMKDKALEVRVVAIEALVKLGQLL